MKRQKFNSGSTEQQKKKLKVDLKENYDLVYPFRCKKRSFALTPKPLPAGYDESDKENVDPVYPFKTSKKLYAQNELDPVYPFDGENVVPMPPFIGAGGGISSNGLELSVNTANPIAVHKNVVTLKYDKPLQLSEKGNLEVAVDGKTVVVNEQGQLSAVLPPTEGGGGGGEGEGEGGGGEDGTFVFGRGRLGQPVSSAYDSPSVQVTDRGTLLAFAVRRDAAECVAARSTDDGCSWTRLRVTRDPVRTTRAASIYDARRHQAWLLLGSCDSTNAVICRSSDDGLCWERRPLGAKDVKQLPTACKGFYGSGGNGIVTRGGTLAFAIAWTDGERFYPGLMYSEDGNEWKFGKGRLPPEADHECSVVEHDRALLLMTAAGERRVFGTTDLGATWCPYGPYDKIVKTPSKVFSSFISFKTNAGLNVTLVGTATGVDREGLTLFLLVPNKAVPVYCARMRAGGLLNCLNYVRAGFGEKLTIAYEAEVSSSQGVKIKDLTFLLPRLELLSFVLGDKTGSFFTRRA